MSIQTFREIKMFNPNLSPAAKKHQKYRKQFEKHKKNVKNK